MVFDTRLEVLWYVASCPCRRPNCPCVVIEPSVALGLGIMFRTTAEHIVKLHNDSLRPKGG
ncbi:hypothetical protein LCGC14_1178920 [marine sediment metagenome]|uniref:Uncharacterized protein n=1 Tax=marine sediment metagenome TaxID=412755 RepID=A0A0F9LSJ7_9ZZZZ